MFFSHPMCVGKACANCISIGKQSNHVLLAPFQRGACSAMSSSPIFCPSPSRPYSPGPSIDNRPLSSPIPVHPDELELLRASSKSSQIDRMTKIHSNSRSIREQLHSMLQQINNIECEQRKETKISSRSIRDELLSMLDQVGHRECEKREESKENKPSSRSIREELYSMLGLVRHSQGERRKVLKMNKKKDAITDQLSLIRNSAKIRLELLQMLNQ